MRRVLIPLMFIAVLAASAEAVSIYHYDLLPGSHVHLNVEGGPFSTAARSSIGGNWDLRVTAGDGSPLNYSWSGLFDTFGPFSPDEGQPFKYDSIGFRISGPIDDIPGGVNNFWDPTTGAFASEQVDTGELLINGIKLDSYGIFGPSFDRLPDGSMRLSAVIVNRRQSEPEPALELNIVGLVRLDSVESAPPADIPEPSSLLLLGAAAAWLRKRKQAA